MSTSPDQDHPLPIRRLNRAEVTTIEAKQRPGKIPDAIEEMVDQLKIHLTWL